MEANRLGQVSTYSNGHKKQVLHISFGIYFVTSRIIAGYIIYSHMLRETLSRGNLLSSVGINVP